MKMNIEIDIMDLNEMLVNSKTFLEMSIVEELECLTNFVNQYKITRGLK